MKALIAKAIGFGVTKKAGLKADLKINDLQISDNDDGVELHLDLNVKMTKEELERVLKSLM
jgi:hypothetical protein